MNFLEKLVTASRRQNSLLCVGLDPEPDHMPAQSHEVPVATAVVGFCHSIIGATQTQPGLLRGAGARRYGGIPGGARGYSRVYSGDC